MTDIIYDESYEAVLDAIVRGIEPDLPLDLPVWSETNISTPRSSAVPGPYRLSHTPFARKVLTCLNPTHPCKRVVAKAASQMMKTQVAINWILGSIASAPANILALEPTDKLAKRLSARISESIAACPVVAEKVAKPRSRDSRNTIDAKDFDGGTLYIVTSGSATNLAEIPARYIFLDEIDRMDMNLDGEGDPVKLAEARATTFEHTAKFYLTSSPTIVDASKIDSYYEMGTQEVYEVACPHCDEYMEFSLENFKYDRADDAPHDVTHAYFVCPHCGSAIEESAKSTMLLDEAAGGKARWSATSESNGETVSFHLSAFYAPLGSISWFKLANEHLLATQRLEKGDSNAMQVFYNTRLALSWDNAIQTSSVAELQARALYAPRIVPKGGLVLTMSVDVQVNRLEAQIEAWGVDMEHWVIDHQVFIGDPSIPVHNEGSPWREVDTLRETYFEHESGDFDLRVTEYAIDTGGANTQDVYNYGRNRENRRCLLIKGSSRPHRPIISAAPSVVDVHWNGQRIEKGAKLWIVGADVGKQWLASRMRFTSGAGAMHFNTALEDEWYEQLLAEKRVITYQRGHAKVHWVKPDGARNEAWDLANYNLAVAHHLGLHKWTEKDWANLRQKLKKKGVSKPYVEEVTTNKKESKPTQKSEPETVKPRKKRRVFSKGVV